nr:PREDICTED: kunitz-type U19-barytoxin-Tl1a-like [Lepisosteus oculatus]
MRSFLAIFLVVLTTLHFSVDADRLLQNTKPECNLTMDEGTGENLHFRLYYDSASDKCLPFMYKGHGGNGNRFITDRWCMQNCSSRASKLYPTGDAVCMLSREQGYCQGHYLLWYYNSAKRKCKTFYFTGCGGNGNRFITQQQCNSTCAGYIDGTLGNDQDDDEITITNGVQTGLIAGIVLGLLGAILLIVVIVLAVKQSKTEEKKGTHREALTAKEDLEMK